MSKIRINELARQLEVKSSKVIEKLSEFGLAEKVTHSSSIDDDMADRLRRYYGGDAAGANETQRKNRNGSSTAVADDEVSADQEPREHPQQAEEDRAALRSKPIRPPMAAGAGEPAAPPRPSQTEPAPEPQAAKQPEAPKTETAAADPASAEAAEEESRPRNLPLRPPLLGRGSPLQPPVGLRPATVSAPSSQTAQTPPRPAATQAAPTQASPTQASPTQASPTQPSGAQPSSGQAPSNQTSGQTGSAPAQPSPRVPFAAPVRAATPSMPPARPFRPAPVATPPSAAPGRPAPRPAPLGPSQSQSPSQSQAPSTPRTAAPASGAAPVGSPQGQSAPANLSQQPPPGQSGAIQQAPPASPSGPSVPPVPAAPGPGVPRPGQVLSGPRQPLPGNVAPGAPRPAAQGARPGVPIAPPPRPSNFAPSGPRPASPGPQQQGRPLAGQPAARPIVPPRPDLVAKLGQQQQRPPMPGQAPPPRPSQPMRPPQQPRPGQPLYQGPARPGQPPMQNRGPGGPSGPGGFRPGGPGGRPGGPRPMHPTSRGLIGPGVPPPPPSTDQASRRPQDRKRTQRDRQQEQEGKLLMQRRREQAAPPPISRDITISEGITVKELSEKLDVKANLVIKKLLDRGIFASINQTLDAKMSTDIAREFGASTSQVTYEEEAMLDVEFAEVDKDLVRRPPVVTIMGHVDHGKTSLLDSIRLAHVADKEAGGITQHIGAYHVDKNGQKIVFIDTPGHEAFTRMRARGAKVTDIVVLVVAADDGVMPQTLEAIDHARAAKVPIIVAINKIDKPEAQVDRIKQQLSDRGLLAEDWGGDTVMVPVSARTKENLDTLLEMILLVAEIQDLKANPTRPAMATVLEAKLDRGRGPVATLLVRNGTLRVGDSFICGTVFGRVRAMIDDMGEQVRETGPSMPVEVLGLEELPEAGDSFQTVVDTTKAKQIVFYRAEKERLAGLAKSSRMTLEQMQKQMASGEVKELFIVLKADVGGSAEVLKDTLERLSTEKVTVRVLRSGVGAINESDVQLAAASNAIIVGFNVRPERGAAAAAEQEKVDLRMHTIIYELVDEMKRAMTGLLAPVFKEVYRGRAEIREVFKVTKVGMVAGCFVQDGHITRDSQCRITRDNIVIFTGKIGSLRRFKDDVSDVRAGMECGITIDNFSDVKQNDIIEAYIMERLAPDLG